LYIISFSNYGKKEEIISNLYLKNYIDKENLDFREKINIKLKNKKNINTKINKLNEKLNEDPLNFYKNKIKMLEREIKPLYKIKDEFPCVDEDNEFTEGEITIKNMNIMNNPIKEFNENLYKKINFYTKKV